MIVMSASNIGKAYGTDIILEDVSFSVNEGDRIGIVGPNGAGKTTLLAMLAKELEPSSGNIFIKSDLTMGFLKQKNNFFADGTVREEAERTFRHFHEMEKRLAKLTEAISDAESPTFDRDLAAYTALLEEYKERGGYSYKNELTGVLRHMGFDEDTYDKKISMLSGGERTRLALACMILRKPDILMLDEPTNHLDLRMLDWLETFLKGYKGTLIVVSHDRYFLDRIVNRIFDVRRHQVSTYRGNYSEYVVKREEKEEVLAREYEKQQKEIKRQEEMIRRFKQHGTEKLVKRAQSREKRLAHIERLDKPAGKERSLKLSFLQDFKSGKDVILAEDLKKSFGERQLFDHVGFDIKSGEKICFIGENGVGKTTLLRILMGEERADDGYLKIGYNVSFGYYDQGQLLLDEHETVLGEMKNTYHLYSDTEMRSLLSRFLFTGDDVFKPISALSGGEKAKLSLLKLMLSGTNTLILDEPTNHLDIESKEVVEAAIADFEGTVLIVSHDRYLLSRIPDRILELTPEGIREFKGKFDYYLEKSAALDADAEDLSTHLSDAGKPSEPQLVKTGTEFDARVKAASETDSQEERRRKKEKEAEERRQRRQLESLEERIHTLESSIEEAENEMCIPEHATDVAFLKERADKVAAWKEELDAAYDEWMDLIGE